MNQPNEWLTKAEIELENARRAWASGNAGLGRVGSRRCAGMAFKALLALVPDEAYGTSFMHHLAAAADDPGLPMEVREAAWRLSARPAPESGWNQPLPSPLTPMADASLLTDYLKGRVAGAAPGEEG